MFGAPTLAWKCTFNLGSKGFIFFLHTCYIVENGYLSYLNYLCDTSVASQPLMDSIQVVCKYIDVLLPNFLDMPPNSNLNVIVDKVSRTKSISISPYRMAPTELK